MNQDKLILVCILYAIGIVSSLICISLDHYMHTKSFKFWNRPAIENVYIAVFLLTGWGLVLFLLVDWVKE